MASTRKPRRAERASSDLLASLRPQLAGLVPPGSRVLVALSGGVDSIVMLDLLRRLAGRRRWRLSALHVNHQLQPQAAAWAAFCRGVCRAAGVPLRVAKVSVAAGNSLEDAARRARYAALLKQPADYIALAHNQDDQAETVLLHLLRGAGVRGLAAMRVVGDPPFGAFRERSRQPKLLRPLLHVPRRDIERYAAERGLEWIEDPSNASRDFTRNFLRVEVLPRVAERFPACRDALARAANHAAEAAELLEALAQADGAAAAVGGGLSVAALRTLTRVRAKNVLVHYLRERGVDIPSAERLEEALRQVLGARRDARVCIELGPKQLRVHRGVALLTAAQDAGRPLDRVWRGEAELALPELGGTLRMERAQGKGISAARLGAGPVTIRARRGGERLRPNAAGATRTVKNLMQEARMPAWERERVPFIYCGDELVCVPGIGIDSAFRGTAREPCIVPVWRAL